MDMPQLINPSVVPGANESSITRTEPSENRFLLGRNIFSTGWDDKNIAKLLSAYHIGYCVCFPIFLNLGDRLGPTWVVGISGILSGVLNCMTPVAAHSKFWLLFAIRIIMGFCAGAMHPSMVQLLRHWVPPVERNYFMWAYCGITLGTTSTFLLCALVQYYSRWYNGFYLIGGFQILWYIIWIFFVTDYPRKHRYISPEELIYLNNAIGTIFTIKITNYHTPWRLILKSIPFWALCILNFGYAWMIIGLSLHGPLYYTRIMQYDLSTASILTAVPFLFRMVLGTALIHVVHWYHQNPHIKRIKYLRKYLIVISHVLPGLLVMSTWISPDHIPGPIFLTISVALTAAGMDLTLILCYKLSPTYMTSINTVIKIIGNVPGIIIALSVGQATYKFKNSIYCWKHIWCFHATVLFLSGVIFLIWGDTTIQPWDAVRRRPYEVRLRPTVRPSTMSNISEVDEEDSSARPSVTQQPCNPTKKSFMISLPFKLSNQN